jgi:hypothetical protein
VAEFIIKWESTHPTGTLFIVHLHDSCARSWVGPDPALYEATFRDHMRQVSLQFAFLTQQRWPRQSSPVTPELVVPTMTYTLQVGAGEPQRCRCRVCFRHACTCIRSMLCMKPTTTAL